MANVAQVKDIMTTQVLSVKNTDTLDYVADLFEKYDYDGLPVTDQEGKLVGIITAYDMVVQSSGMHLPTVLNIMDKISVNQADKKMLDEHFQKLHLIQANEIMNKEPLTVTPEMGIEEAAKEFAQHHRVNPLIVVDGDKRLVGVVSRYDVIKFFNEKYFSRILESHHPDSMRGVVRSDVEKQVESAVGDISKQYVLVGKVRPKVWKIIAIAAFIAGFIAAMAFIIRIVRKQDDYYGLLNSKYQRQVDNGRSFLASI